MLSASFPKTPRSARRFRRATAATLLAEYRPSGGADRRSVRPTQDNIDRRTRIVTVGDLKIALLPKKNRGETVNVRTNFRWGDLTSLNGRSIEGELAGTMLSRGTDKLLASRSPTR